MGTAKITLWAAVLVLGWAATSFVLAQEDHEKKPAPPQVIMVKGQLLKGWYVPPADERSFRFRWEKTNSLLVIYWDTMTEKEKAWAKKQFGIQTADDGIRQVYGEKIKATKYTLKNSSAYVGIDIDAELPHPPAGIVRVKTARSIVTLPAQDIATQEAVEVYESDVYSPAEIYRSWMDSGKAPQDAKEHYELGRRIAEWGLYEKALEHLEKARELKPEVYQDSTADFKTELERKLKKQDAEQLYDTIIKCYQRSEYFAALEKITQFERLFADSEYFTKVQALKEIASKENEKDLTKQVVQYFYYCYSDLLRQKVSEKLYTDQPPIMGKRIITKTGRVYQGRLAATDEESVTLEHLSQPLKFVIKKEVIDKMSDADLAEHEGSKSYHTFAALSAWVRNKSRGKSAEGGGTSGGLYAELVHNCAEKLGIKEDEVMKLFDSRIGRMVVVDASGVQADPDYTQSFVADYGPGSWLRGGGGGDGATTEDGRRPTPSRQGTSGDSGSLNGFLRGTGRDGRITEEDRRRYNQWLRNQRGNQSGNQPGQQGATRQLSQEEWWQLQPASLRLAVLKAMAAETFFYVEEVVNYECPTCARRGQLKMITPAGYQWVTCPTCRGRGLLVKVRFR